MRTPLHIIYVPGLGDHRTMGQRQLVNLWRWWGVEPEMVRMRWSSNESWAIKFNHLLARIDAAAADGKNVALVGVSAGASAAINAFAARKDTVVGVVCIAGKINRPEAIGQRYAQRNPAFVTSVQQCQLALARLTTADRRRIMSRYAILDGLVSRTDSRVQGARNRIVPSIGHGLTIALQITLGAPSFIRFLKRTAAKIK